MKNDIQYIVVIAIIACVHAWTGAAATAAATTAPAAVGRVVLAPSIFFIDVNAMPMHICGETRIHDVQRIYALHSSEMYVSQMHVSMYLIFTCALTLAIAQAFTVHDLVLRTRGGALVAALDQETCWEPTLDGLVPALTTPNSPCTDPPVGWLGVDRLEDVYFTLATASLLNSDVNSWNGLFNHINEFLCITASDEQGMCVHGLV